jgi:hypothetical protein
MVHLPVIGVASTSTTPRVIDEDQLYRDAEEAFDSLAHVLRASKTDWFFDAEKPGLFDASVFAYTLLVLDTNTAATAGMEWGNGRLGDVVRKAVDGELVRHRDRVWERCWGDSDRGVLEYSYPIVRDQDLDSDGDDVNVSWRDGDDAGDNQGQDLSWVGGRESEWRGEGSTTTIVVTETETSGTVFIDTTSTR